MPTAAALRVINQARVLTALRRTGPHSRVSLSRELGLTRSTMTVIVNALMERGLVGEVDAERDPRATGRPRVEIGLRGCGAYFGGLDVGNEAITAVIADLNGELVEHTERALEPGTTAEAAEQVMVQMMRDLLARRPDVHLEGVGLTLPGMVGPDGILRWAPRLGWRDVAIGRAVHSALRVPVLVENDANAAAVAEALISSAEDVPNLLYVLLESGVGGGVLVNGRLYRGSLGRVGEIGHVRLSSTLDGRPAELVEDLLDATAFRRAAGRAMGTDVGWEELARAGSELPAAVRQLRDRWQHTLGWLTSTMTWLLDPDLIVFGGSAAELLTQDTTCFDQALAEYGIDPATTPYVVSRLGRTATTMGAVSLPMRSFFAIHHEIFTAAPTPDALEAVS